MFKKKRSTHHRQVDDQTSFKLGPFFVAIVVTTSLIWILLPTPVEKINPSTPVSDSDLIALVTKFSSSEGLVPSVLSSRDGKLAAFGRKLFFDARLSVNGKVSCATCHQPDRAFTDGLRFSRGVGEATRNAPTLVNSAAAIWFFWDGRADSLAAQALQPLEHPNEHGINRAFAVNFIKREYLADYEALFGPWPLALKSEFAKNAGPRPKRRQLPVALTAYGLQTIGNFDVLEGVLDRAGELGLAPAEELGKRSAAIPLIDLQWIKAWESLTVETQAAINQVFASSGQAIEAFEKGIVAIDSPFDQFAVKLASGSTAEQAFNANFGHDELAGFRLFVGKGHCTNCHMGPMFTDQQFHNTGFKGRAGSGEIEIDLGRAQGIADVIDNEFNCLGVYLGAAASLGRGVSESCLELPYLAANNIEFVGAFKTPTLRNIAATAPYGHDGRFSTLEEILNHYNRLGQKPTIGHQEDSLQPLYLKAVELNQLEKFLRSLTSPIKDLSTGHIIKQAS